MSSCGLLSQEGPTLLALSDPGQLPGPPPPDAVTLKMRPWAALRMGPVSGTGLGGFSRGLEFGQRGIWPAIVGQFQVLERRGESTCECIALYEYVCITLCAHADT